MERGKPQRLCGHALKRATCNPCSIYVGCGNGKSRQEQTSEISAGSRIEMRVRIMFSGANCASTRPQKNLEGIFCQLGAQEESTQHKEYRSSRTPAHQIGKFWSYLTFPSVPDILFPRKHKIGLPQKLMASYTPANEAIEYSHETKLRLDCHVTTLTNEICEYAS